MHIGEYQISACQKIDLTISFAIKISLPSSCNHVSVKDRDSEIPSRKLPPFTTA